MGESENYILTRRSLIAKVLLAAGLSGAAAVSVLDMVVRRGQIFAKIRPNFDAYHTISTFVIALSSALVVVGFVLLGDRLCRVRADETQSDWDGWNDAGMLPRRGHRPGVPVKRAIAWLVTVFCAASVGLFAVSAYRFSRFAREDNPIETISAVLLFVAVGLFIRSAYRVRRRCGKVVIAYFLGLAVAFFVVGMEEISWGQRYFDWETPESFASNAQGELNFHNFATIPMELTYYFGMFVALVAGPFVVASQRPWRRFRSIDRLAPLALVIYVGALATCFTHGLWNVLPMQFAYFSSLAILICFAVDRVRNGNSARLEIAVIATMIVAQATFLVRSEHFVRAHDVTEYREFIVPLACLLYALQIRRIARTFPSTC